MPITGGPLTQRLQQLLADIVEFFTTANTALAAIKANSDILISTTATAQNFNLATLRTTLINIQNQLGTINTTQNAINGSLGQIRDGVGIVSSDPTLRASLRYLTQSGDGTPLNRNLQSVVDQVFDLQGARPDEKTLYDVWVALQSPSGPRLQTIIEKLDILLDEKLGDPTSPLTMLGLTQLIQACICSIDEKTPPIDPPPPTPNTIPASHACAPSEQLLFQITPDDWYEWSPGFWRAAPNALYAGMEDWELVFSQQVGAGTTQRRSMRLKVLENPTTGVERTCRVTTDTASEIYQLEPLHGQNGTTTEGELVAFSTGADITGVTNSATGCKTIALLSDDPLEYYWALNNNPGGSDPSDRVLNTLYFYAIPPN